MHHFLVVWSPTNLHNHCLIHYFLQLLPHMESTTYIMNFKSPLSICLAWSDGSRHSITLGTLNPQCWSTLPDLTVVASPNHQLAWLISTIDQPHLIQWLSRNIARISAQNYLPESMREKWFSYATCHAVRLITWNFQILFTAWREREKLLIALEMCSLISTRFFSTQYDIHCPSLDFTHVIRS